MHFNDVTVEAEENRRVKSVIAREKVVQLTLLARISSSCRHCTLTDMMMAKA